MRKKDAITIRSLRGWMSTQQSCVTIDHKILTERMRYIAAVGLMNHNVKCTKLSQSISVVVF